MALSDTSVMQPIINDLASAYVNIISTVDFNRTPHNMLYWLTDARNRVVSATSGAAADYDAAITLQTNFRSLEKTLPSTVSPIMAKSASALNSYFVTNNLKKFRDYWDGKTTNTTLNFNDDFREFWRISTGEEVIVKLGHASYPWSGGSKYTIDNTNPTVATPFEIRTASLIGSVDIVLNATLVTANGTNELVTLTIPAHTPIGTSLPLAGSSLKYTGIYQSAPGVYSISISGGSSGDSIQLWLK